MSLKINCFTSFTSYHYIWFHLGTIPTIPMSISISIFISIPTSNHNLLSTYSISQMHHLNQKSNITLNFEFKFHNPKSISNLILKIEKSTQKFNKENLIVKTKETITNKRNSKYQTFFSLSNYN